MLDSSSDSVVIAKKDQVSYLNDEAWRFLGCMGSREEVQDYSQVVCLDRDSGREVPLVEQLKTTLLVLDGRLRQFKKTHVLEQLIEMATSPACLLELAPIDNSKNPEWKDPEAQVPVIKLKPEEARINGVFFDTRIKTHNFNRRRQVVIMFTNVSAVKEL